ncbi:MAG: hypothetical protein EON58_10235 [Alphaproteobacteria bacterium]|nr:MAG: hypothetical protein EON58_10235 [Alphaproteobacteria bacterium]
MKAHADSSIPLKERLLSFRTFLQVAMVRYNTVRSPLDHGGDPSHGVAYTVAQKSDARSLPGVAVG